MPDIHIEDFYKDLARILIHLHSYFPRKCQVFVEDISGPDQPDEYGLHSVRHQSCFSAMLWLADEGFIRFDDTIRDEAIDQAVLTQKTFLRLNQLAKPPLENTAKSHADASGLNLRKPAITGEPHTNVSLIRHTLKTGTSTRLARLLEAVIFIDPTN